MRVIVLMFFREPAQDRVVVVTSNGLSSTAIGVAVLLTIALGVVPQTVLATLGNAAMLVP